MSESRKDPDSKTPQSGDQPDPAGTTASGTDRSDPAGEPVADAAAPMHDADGAPAGPEDAVALLEAAQAQIADYHDQLLRARAEVENVRRRAQEDVTKARKFGTESFAGSLIPVRDSLEAALAHEEQTAEDWRKGVEATLRQLNTAFESNHMHEVAPQPGEAFDPHKHQAISSIASEYPAGTIVQLLQKGYLIADRVLRPALVTVSAGQPEG